MPSYPRCKTMRSRLATSYGKLWLLHDDETQSQRKETDTRRTSKDKLKDSIMNIVPETVYDLTFYQNLIENSQKILLKSVNIC